MAPSRNIFLRSVAACERPRIAGVVRLMGIAQKNRPIIAAQSPRVCGHIPIKPPLNDGVKNAAVVMKVGVGFEFRKGTAPRLPGDHRYRAVAPDLPDQGVGKIRQALWAPCLVKREDPQSGAQLVL